MKDEKDPQQQSTLNEDDIEVSKKSLGRRTAVRLGGVVVMGSALAVVAGCGRRRVRVVRVQTVGGGTDITDRDAGPGSDAAGYGRGGGGTGITDNDAGPNSDPVGYGRGGGGTGITDADGGPNADAPGYGRGGRSGVTDSDGGPNADAPGYGRRGY